MLSWVLPLLVLAYGATVVLIALNAGFSSRAPRRDAAYKVLKVLLPAGFLALVVHILLVS